jgi:signal transduction histidine kinase/uncharacterized membrane protein YkoI
VLPRLRLQLMAVYAIGALVMLAIFGAGTYLIVARYFQDVTDLALRHKMTHELHRRNLPIPDELAFADRDWSILRSDLSALSLQPGGMLTREQAVAIAVAYRGSGTPSRVKVEDEDGSTIYEIEFENGDEVSIDSQTGRIIERKAGENSTLEDQPIPSLDQIAGNFSYDAELAAIFVLPLGADGRLLISQPGNTLLPRSDKGALQAALTSGSDLRTIVAPDGQQVRLYTYRTDGASDLAALQLGRSQSDQRQVLLQLSGALAVLGGLGTILVGLGSWFLAGRALRPAQIAWERQQGFIASASHELRTPLTLIRASAEVAQRHTLTSDTEQRALLGDVLSEVDHMRTLVDDLLTLSRLDSGRLTIQPGPIDLAVLLSDVQRQVGRLAEQRGIQVALEQSASGARGDRDRVRQVLIILLDNALRYTPDGSVITLSAALRGRMVEVSVTDTGPGIAPDHLPHIFDRFYRADPARGREGGNAGLGLAIARGLIEAQGGQIRAESQAGRGTRVSFTLPAA